MKLLDGKRALVTGGSRGLGLAICNALAEQGARVAFTYTRDDETAAGTRAAIAKHGGEAKSYRVDVLDVPGTALMVKDLETTWGGVDVLVNNAGVTANLPLALLEEEDWDRVMDINMKGVFLTSKAVLRGMIRRKSGVILVIGSLAGTRMLEAPIHYCSSKAALVGFTRSLSKEVARHQVRVNCLAPGLLEDGIGKNLPDYKLGDYLRHCALGRVGTFDEVAKLAAFMVSDANSYMSGETVVMDGSV